jgi:hypothetical protein
VTVGEVGGLAVQPPRDVGAVTLDLEEADGVVTSPPSSARRLATRNGGEAAARPSTTIR